MATRRFKNDSVGVLFSGGDDFFCARFRGELFVAQVLEEAVKDLIRSCNVIVGI